MRKYVMGRHNLLKTLEMSCDNIVEENDAFNNEKKGEVGLPLLRDQHISSRNYKEIQRGPSITNQNHQFEYSMPFSDRIGPNRKLFSTCRNPEYSEWFFCRGQFTSGMSKTDEYTVSLLHVATKSLDRKVDISNYFDMHFSEIVRKILSKT
ncbi:hypothetical protein WA026_014595 [Henosepilachna vigintioctopunctata]|uniref:Uncharacterized protein n=1 Tax=Henosepilachna vigintioctopunctata TaxID=420089 RepID=A0AAW1V6N0_9CUCU